MQFACNYLNEVAELLKEGKISVDYLKYPSIEDTSLEKMKEIKKETNTNILYHGFLTKSGRVADLLSNNFIEDTDIEANKEAIEITSTPGLSMHLGNDCFYKDNKDYSLKELLNILYKNVDFLKSTFGTDLEFIEIENRQQANNIETLTPQFITEAINITETNFLIDISHAANAARILGMEYYDYLKKLPLDKVNETHINGWRLTQNNMISHFELTSEAYNAVKFIIDNTPVNIVTLEYGVSNNMLKFLNEDEKNLCSDIPIVEFNALNKKAKDEVLRQVIKVKEICNL